MLDRYIKINDKVIESKQTAAGVWYCANAPADTAEETDTLIGKLNAIYNKYNKKTKEENKKVK